MTKTRIERVDVSAYTVPTDAPESDGTLDWDSTTIVVVALSAAGSTGFGYTYGDRSIAELIRSKLHDRLRAVDALEIPEAWDGMHRALRNEGLTGHAMMAISAVDIAMWDLKARLLGLSLVDLFGAVRPQVVIYGSGGFTSYEPARVAEQLGAFIDQGITRVKMKISREPDEDPARLDTARKAIGDAELFVDSNGAFHPKQALEWAYRLRSEWNVSWFEEPVSSDDVDGLRFVRDRGPAGLDIAAGEYGYALTDFLRLCGAVDCLQADVTRCGGFTGFLRVSALCDAFAVDLSAHCAPAASAPVMCAAPRARHLEYFHDHVRVERMLFDGVLEPIDGTLRPDRSRPGLGVELKSAERYRAA